MTLYLDGKTVSINKLFPLFINKNSVNILCTCKNISRYFFLAYCDVLNKIQFMSGLLIYGYEGHEKLLQKIFKGRNILLCLYDIKYLYE